MADTTTNLTDLKERITELTKYIALSHPSDVEALSDDLEELSALVVWKIRDSKRITHDEQN